MEKDFRLEEIFDAYRPDLGDGAKFMATLQHRLEAAEYLRAMREAERRHCRRMMLAALLAGLVIAVIHLLGMEQGTPLPHPMKKG